MSMLPSLMISNLSHRISYGSENNLNNYKKDRDHDHQYALITLIHAKKQNYLRSKNELILSFYVFSLHLLDESALQYLKIFERVDCLAV